MNEVNVNVPTVERLMRDRSSFQAIHGYFPKHLILSKDNVFYFRKQLEDFQGGIAISDFQVWNKFMGADIIILDTTKNVIEWGRPYLGR